MIRFSTIVSLSCVASLLVACSDEGTRTAEPTTTNSRAEALIGGSFPSGTEWSLLGFTDDEGAACIGFVSDDGLRGSDTCDQAEPPPPVYVYVGMVTPGEISWGVGALSKVTGLELRVTFSGQEPEQIPFREGGDLPDGWTASAAVSRQACGSISSIDVVTPEGASLYDDTGIAEMATWCAESTVTLGGP